MTYGNECEVHAAGRDLSVAGGCPPPQGYFACGPRFCQHDREYCQIVISGPSGTPPGYGCNALPPTCGGVPSCPCIQFSTCSTGCTESSAGDVTVTCNSP
jgi:hypothetical protein